MIKKVLTEYQRGKEDNSDDSLYYAQPRFVHHLDDEFRNRLTKLYAEQIPEGSVVLDLMSSWASHLPDNIQYKSVIGHGLNQAELENNKKLNKYWVQNFNQNSKLPLDSSTIDACLIVAGWQYLQYPEEIASELKRIIRPDGKLIVSFSNRAFWAKTPAIWNESSDSEHINYVKAILISQGWSNKIDIINEKGISTGLNRLLGISSDPFISVIATN